MRYSYILEKSKKVEGFESEDEAKKAAEKATGCKIVRQIFRETTSVVYELTDGKWFTVCCERANLTVAEAEAQNKCWNCAPTVTAYDKRKGETGSDSFSRMSDKGF
jgi:hypothetical protein